MRSKSKLGVLFLAAVMALASCGSDKEKAEVTTSDVKQEAKETIETTQAFVAQQKEAYEKKIEAELDEFGSRIEELKARAQDAGTETEKEVNNAIEELRSKKKTIRNNLEQLKDQSAEAWKEMKEGVDAALEDLERSYERALARLK